MSKQYQLGFIGAGNMAEAIVRAAIEQNVVSADRVIMADPVAERGAAFADLVEQGMRFTTSNAEVFAATEQVVLAIKPQAFGKIAGDLAEHLVGGQVLVSIMAGIASRTVVEALPEKRKSDVGVVRVMPNTPLLVGRGMAGVAIGVNAAEADAELAMKLFNAGDSEAVLVEEKLMDAVTAVSGSGPAYLFYLAEAMEEAAREIGLGEHAELFVSQTLLGAAELLSQSADSAAELRKKVTSPNGTTQAATDHFDAAAVKAGLVAGIKAARDRGEALGKSQ